MNVENLPPLSVSLTVFVHGSVETAYAFQRRFSGGCLFFMFRSAFNTEGKKESRGEQKGEMEEEEGWRARWLPFFRGNSRLFRGGYRFFRGGYRGSRGSCGFFFAVTDSTIAPPKTSDFLYRTFHGCSTQGRILVKNIYPHNVLCAKVYRSITSRCRGTQYFRRYDRELVLTPAIWLKKTSGWLP